MKHTQLFRQRSQDHSEVISNTLEEGNSSVTREVPIHGLFNAGQCVNTYGELTKEKNISPSIMTEKDYDMPELVVFIQEEENEQLVKDTSVYNKMMPRGRGLLEDCEFHHNIMPCFFEPNLKISGGSNVQTMEIMSTKSNNGSECASQNTFTMNATMKKYDCSRNLMFEAEVKLDSRDTVSTDQATNNITSHALREFLRKEANISRSIKNWQMNSFLGSIGSGVEFAHCAADYLQVIDGTSMPTSKMIGNPQSLLPGSLTRQVDYLEKTSSCCVAGSIHDGPTSYAGCTTTSSIGSHQSNDSTSSKHSFAFPILEAKWNGSPVRMIEDKSQSQKQCRKKWFPCCKCC